MTRNAKPAALQSSEISAVIHRGLTVKTSDGRPARLAIIDDNGHILDAGAVVEREAWNVAIASYRNFLIGQGHLLVRSGPVAQVGELQSNA